MSKSRRSNRRSSTRRNRRNRRNVTRRGGFFGKLFKKSSPAPVAAPVAAAPVKTRNNRVRNATVFVNAEMAKGKQPYAIYMNVRNNGGPHLAGNIKNAIAAKGVNVSGWV